MGSNWEESNRLIVVGVLNREVEGDKYIRARRVNNSKIIWKGCKNHTICYLKKSIMHVNWHINVHIYFRWNFLVKVDNALSKSQNYPTKLWIPYERIILFLLLLFRVVQEIIKTLQIIAIIVIHSYINSPHPSSRKYIFATDGDSHRKPQLVLNAGIFKPVSIDTSTK